ncbi:hypothetical protein DJ568_12800 [Mucilaginibacter hurinus]|uniref:Uncharacterized protein n=1 Tax=Mucilaginibacter hurinus TaxID=2201324 RepID=A0A367GL25_9SPHI|nr:hypothetical protein [Mucilaginibacter hurinus]RCH54177.1 hypothetical protein DJ568_12800 [Mucilaginibacter hurinus]
MKRTILLIYVLLISACAAFAQPGGFDVITKTDGTTHTGKVMDMGDNDIKFVYKGETLNYTFKKVDVQKIVFASGREEVVNAPAQKGNIPAAKPENKGKVAILPFGLIVNDQRGSDDKAYVIQQECYNAMTKKAGNLQFLDPITTNAVLIKHNINEQNIRGYTMVELSNLLGVQYLVQGVVTITPTSVSTSTSGGGNTNATIKKEDKDKATVKSSDWGSAYSSTSQNFSTTVLMNIFDDTGAKIFGKNHQAFWPTQDAYKITLDYLAKRTPLYQK